MKIFVSKQERERKRKKQLRITRNELKRLSNKQRKKEKEYWILAARAYKVGNKKMLLKLASMIENTRKTVKIVEERLLAIDMVEAMRDQAVASAEFAKAFQSMAESILDSANPDMLDEIQETFDQSMDMAELLDERLDEFQEGLDEMLMNMDSEEEKGELMEIIRMIKSEAEQEPEVTTDPEIEALEKQIEMMLGRKV